MMATLMRRHNLGVKALQTFRWISKRQNILSTKTHTASCQQHRCMSSDNLLLKHFKSRIKANGPITVAEYMKEVLTNPVAGYYMHKDVFGAGGDFITSPEISQMFGEMLGIWCLNEWLEHGSDLPLQLVELGPGRGTLADDILRVFSQFPQLKDKVSLHLVEVSPTLSHMQKAKISGQEASAGEATQTIDSSVAPYAQCQSKYGHPVFWYQDLSDVPRGLSCFLAHEFLDALPIHKFQKTEKGWCEVLVDFDDHSSNLKFVLSHGPTVTCSTYLQVAPGDKRTHIEVCPAAGALVQQLASRVTADGGWALLADYGHDGEKEDTFRGFRKHELYDPLKDPGLADLTADVDFSYLKTQVENQVTVFGPITQQMFLNNMGIGVRLQVLLQRQQGMEGWKELVSGYNMLMHPDKMGERFKFMGFQHKDYGVDYTPAGFATPQNMAETG